MNKKSDNRVMGFLENIQNKNVWIFLVINIFLVSIIISFYNTKSIEQKLAWKGASPHNYVAEKLYPENFKRNWPAAGVDKYDFSLSMKIYYYLAKYFQIRPSATTYPYMYIQTIFFLFSVAFLSYTLFENLFVAIVSIIIIPVSGLAGLNLARFGHGFASYLSYPLFYGYATSFCIFAISFYLRNNYMLCSIFLASAIYCHTNIGVLILAFLSGYLFCNPKLLRERTFIISVVIFVIMVIPHFLFIMQNASISTGGLNKNVWVKLTKIFSFHWYPLTMKLFTKRAMKEFFPFVLAIIFFIQALRYHDYKSQKHMKIISGMLICIILSGLGIIFSDIFPIPLLIKISPQRSSAFITFFSVIYLIFYLIKKMEIGNSFIRIISVYALGVLMISDPGIAIIPLFILSYLDLKEGHFGFLRININTADKLNRFYFRTAGLIILFIVICTVTHGFNFSLISYIVDPIYKHLWTPLQHFNPFSNFDFLIRGGSFKSEQAFILLLTVSILIPIVITKAEDYKNLELSKVFTGILISLSVGIIWHLEYKNYSYWHKRFFNIASSYLDAQLWARENTPIDSLFMTDPTHYYGWRDFSERSSFGNLREWGYSSIAYNPNINKYKQTIKRLKEFDIYIEKISSDDIKEYDSFPYSRRFKQRAKDIYYGAEDTWRIKLAQKYGIDYFIMQKELMTKPSKLPIRYENQHYVLLSSK